MWKKTVVKIEGKHNFDKAEEIVSLLRKQVQINLQWGYEESGYINIWSEAIDEIKIQEYVKNMAEYIIKNYGIKKIFIKI